MLLSWRGHRATRCNNCVRVTARILRGVGALNHVREKAHFKEQSAERHGTLNECQTADNNLGRNTHSEGYVSARKSIRDSVSRAAPECIE